MEDKELIIGFGSLFISSVGVVIAMFYNAYQVRKQSELVKLNFFAIYTGRYQEIIKTLPYEIFDDDFDISKLPNDQKDEIIKTVRLYCDLCSEEYDLWKNKYIEDRIWKNWEEGIKYCFSRKAFRQAWDVINRNSNYYEDFGKFMRDKILNA